MKSENYAAVCICLCNLELILLSDYLLMLGTVINRICYFNKWRLGGLCCFEKPFKCFIFFNGRIARNDKPLNVTIVVGRVQPQSGLY